MDTPNLPANVSLLPENNLSRVSDSASLWDVPSLATIILCILIFLFNGMTLFVFIRDRTLQTPFSVHLKFLLGINSVYAASAMPLRIFNNIYVGDWQFGNGWCSVYIYADLILPAIGIHAHILITANRMWALFFPLSYRKSSAKHAYFLCLAIFVYIHCVIMPLIIYNEWHYPLPTPPGDRSCENKEHNAFSNPWGIFAQYAIYLPPEIFCLFAYPFIWYKQKLVHENSVKMRNYGRTQHRLTVQNHRLLNKFSDSSLAAYDRHETWNPPDNPNSGREFRLLTLLSASIFICWTPINIYYKMVPYLPNLNLDPIVLPTVTILMTCQMALDPVIFIIAMKNLVPALRDAVGFSRR